MFIYAVTNWHVAVRDGASIIRVNKKGGGIDVFEFDPSEWSFIPNGPDIAVLLPSSLGGLNQAIHNFVPINVNMLLTESDVTIMGINSGDDIFMLGRFVDHDGAASNVPAARFGNISVMPQVIKQPTGARSIPSFILDVHSRTGYSGSPVFVYRTHGSDLTTVSLNLGAPGGHFVKLLGVHWGQFPEQWEIETGKAVAPEGATLAADARYIRGLSGMTLAIPAWTLMEFLDMPKLKQQREQVAENLKQARGRGPIGEAAARPTNEANPKDREDFNSLLRAAAQKREPED